MRAEFKKGLTNPGVLFSVFALILVSVSYVVFAAHTSSATISPEWADVSTSEVYTITVSNTGGDDIEEVRITAPAGYSNITSCGTPPTGWSLDSQTNRRCSYVTAFDYITDGTSEDFTLTITTPASSGTYTWQVKTLDINLGVGTLHPTSKIDGTAPTITDDYASDGTWVKSEQTVTLNPQDGSGSGIKEVKYCTGVACDPSGGTTLSSPYQLSYTTDQDTTVKYQAWDNVDNPSSVGEYNVKLDKTAPTTSDDAPSGWQTSDVTITLTESDPSPSSGIAWTKYCTDAADSCSPDTDYTGAVTISTEGTTYFRYASQDNAGNTQTTVSRTIQLDKTAPTSSASSPDYDNVGTITVTIATLSDSGESGVADVDLWYRYDNENDGDFTGPSDRWWTNSGLTPSAVAVDGVFDFDTSLDGDGAYEFYTIATDTAGNPEDAPTVADDSTIYDTVDPTKPGTPTHSDDANSGYDDDTSLDFTWIASSDTNFDEYNVYVSENSGSYSLAGTTETNSYTLTTGVTDGNNYKIKVEGVDSAGNVGEQSNESSTIIVDTAAPTMDSAITGDSASGSSNAKDKIVVTFSEDLLDASVSAGDFTVASNTVIAASEASGIVTLTLGTELSTGDTPLVSIAGNVEDLAGNELTTGSVTASDGLNPEMISAETKSQTTIDVVFGDIVSDIETSDFTVMNGEISISVSGVLVTDKNVTLTLASSIGVDDTPVISLAGNGVQDAAGNAQTTGTVTAIDGIPTQTGSETVIFYTGWNFISAPKELQQSAVSQIFAGKAGFSSILEYNADTGTWTIPTSIEPLHGYWVYASSPFTVTLTYETSSTNSPPPTKQVYQGWNAIGTTHYNSMKAESALVSIDSAYSHVMGWNSGSQTYTSPGINGIASGESYSNVDFDMTPGQGYWVYATASATLAALVA